jgi:hypothetical protein
MEIHISHNHINRNFNYWKILTTVALKCFEDFETISGISTLLPRMFFLSVQIFFSGRHKKIGIPQPATFSVNYYWQHLNSIPLSLRKKVFSVSYWNLGCQIFPGTIYQQSEKYTKLPQNMPNFHKIYQMAVK